MDCVRNLRIQYDGTMEAVILGSRVCGIEYLYNSLRGAVTIIIEIWLILNVIFEIDIRWIRNFSLLCKIKQTSENNRLLTVTGTSLGF